jgi:hypothetical protein
MFAVGRCDIGHARVDVADIRPVVDALLVRVLQAAQPSVVGGGAP